MAQWPQTCSIPASQPGRKILESLAWEDWPKELQSGAWEEETWRRRYLKSQVQVTEGLLRAGGTTLPSSDSRTEVVGMMGEPPNR